MGKGSAFPPAELLRRSGNDPTRASDPGRFKLSGLVQGKCNEKRPESEGGLAETAAEEIEHASTHDAGQPHDQGGRFGNDQRRVAPPGSG